jgi:hypothetical protein
MIGTLDDTPLQMVTVDNTAYLLDRQKGKVFLNAKGIPEVEDKDTVKAVIEAAE